MNTLTSFCKAPQKSRAFVVALLLLSVSLPCFGKKKAPADTGDGNTRSLVTAVSPANGGGTVTISDGDAPFVVTGATIILVDGQTATFSAIHVGMKVVSRTLPDGTESEIDLKTVATPANAKKGGQNKKADGSDSDSQ